jgi:hypothetical protein
MGTTTKGLPYPANTAAPNVPADMQALAESLDFTMVRQLSPATVNATSSITVYPLGMSIMSPTNAEAGPGGWPSGVGGTLVTWKPTSAKATQVYYRGGSSPVAAYTRQLIADPGPHSAWAGAAAPYASAAGSTSMDGSTNPTAGKLVTFPAGKFSLSPHVVVSSSSSAWMVAVLSTTSTSVTIIGRYIVSSTSNFTATWHAHQMLNTTSDG